MTHHRNAHRAAACFIIATASALLPASELAAQTAEPSSGAVLQTQPESQPGAAAAAATRLVEAAKPDAKGRRLAPHDTFYLLSYVSAKTDKGVEGFPPGQEVKLVEVHRDSQTLVVSNGHAQVEVSPSKLTNDLDIAALVSRNDQASQAQIASYLQAEQEAYAKEQKEVAVNTARNIEKEQEKKETVERETAGTKLDQLPPQNASAVYPGAYYGSSGYGYGSPYSYFTGAPVTITAPVASKPPTTAPSVPNKVAVPGSGNPGPGRPR